MNGVQRRYCIPAVLAIGVRLMASNLGPSGFGWPMFLSASIVTANLKGMAKGGVEERARRCEMSDV